MHLLPPWITTSSSTLMILLAAVTVQASTSGSINPGQRDLPFSLLDPYWQPKYPNISDPTPLLAPVPVALSASQRLVADGAQKTGLVALKILELFTNANRTNGSTTANNLAPRVNDTIALMRQLMHEGLASVAMVNRTDSPDALKEARQTIKEACSELSDQLGILDALIAAASQYQAVLSRYGTVVNATTGQDLEMIGSRQLQYVWHVDVANHDQPNATLAMTNGSLSWQMYYDLAPQLFWPASEVVDSMAEQVNGLASSSSSGAVHGGAVVVVMMMSVVTTLLML